MLILLGIWGEEELILGILGAKANTFREMRTLFAGRRGDQCIIFRDLGSTDLPGGPQLDIEVKFKPHEILPSNLYIV